MKNVTRYEFEVHEGGGEVVASETGGFVDYDDYLLLIQVNSALQTSQDNIINALGIKGDGPLSKLVIEYVLGLLAERDALAAENACLKQDIDSIADVMETGTDGALFSAIDEAVGLNTPATDSVLARIKAQGVDEQVSRLEDEYGEIDDVCAMVFRDLRENAANLRAGRKG